MDPNPKFRSDIIWNVLSILALFAIVVVMAVVLVVYINPNTDLNPFQPPKLPALASLPDESSSTNEVSATRSPPTETPILLPTQLPTPEPVVISPTTVVFSTEMPIERPQTEILYEFEVIGGSLALPASEYDPARGCDWMGVAGQVFDIQGAPVKGIRLALRVELAERSVDLVAISGTSLLYGEAGYEFNLADRPIASTGHATIQLVDQAGLPLSDVFYFDTYEDCDQNLILIDFYEIR